MFEWECVKMTPKELTSMRISKATKEYLRRLTESKDRSQADIIASAIEHYYRDNIFFDTTVDFDVEKFIDPISKYIRCLSILEKEQIEEIVSALANRRYEELFSGEGLFAPVRNVLDFTVEQMEFLAGGLYADLYFDEEGNELQIEGEGIDPESE
jgi:hypothetical protein